MSDDTPDLGDVITAALDGALEGVRVALPGRIEAYSNGRATVQALVMDVAYDESDARTPVPIAPFTDVPVAQLGFGTIRVKLPVKKGDRCWLLISSSSLARHKASDGATVVDPGDDRHHHEADAIAIPFVAVGGEDADAMIEFTDGGLIKAGGDQPLVTRAEFLAHVHADPTSGVTGTPTLPPGPPPVDPTFPGTPRLRG